MNASGVSSTDHLSSLYGTYSGTLGSSAALPVGPPSVPAGPSIKSQSSVGCHSNRIGGGSHKDKQGVIMVNQEVTMVNLDTKQKEDKNDPHNGKLRNSFDYVHLVSYAMQFNLSREQFL